MIKFYLYPTWTVKIRGTENKNVWYRTFVASPYVKFLQPRLESQYKFFWQNLVSTFCPLYTCEKGTKCGNQVLSKNFVLWFYSRASPAHKSQGWKVIYFKTFSRATFFVFWGTHLVDRYLSYLPVKQIWRKSTVCMFAVPQKC